MSQFAQKTVRLYLVRHGETADNIHMRYLGIRDIPLTTKGQKQARDVATALSELRVHTVFSSPLRRAAETAMIIQAACGADLRLDARLSEGSFGKWEGRTRAEVQALGALDADLLKQWESDPSCAPPGGESLQSIQARVVSFADESAREFTGASLVVVSHVGPIKALLATVLGIPLQSTRRLVLDPGTISTVDWGSEPVLHLFNSHAHLGWNSARWMN